MAPSWIMYVNPCIKSSLSEASITSREKNLCQRPDIGSLPCSHYVARSVRLGSVKGRGVAFGVPVCACVRACVRDYMCARAIICVCACVCV